MECPVIQMKIQSRILKHHNIGMCDCLFIACNSSGVLQSERDAKGVHRIRTYPADVFAGWTDEGAHNVIVDTRIVNIKGNLQQDL